MGLLVLSTVATAVGVAMIWATKLLPGGLLMGIRAVVVTLLGMAVLAVGVRLVTIDRSSARRAATVAWRSMGDTMRRFGLIRLARRARPLGAAVLALVVGVALVAGLSPTKMAQADPVEQPSEPTRPEGTTAVSDPTNAVPASDTSTEVAIHDPYRFYETPDVPGEVVDAGDGWATYQTG
jgi:hypothetical protein